MHVVNKSADWLTTTNPVRHIARRQPETQGQAANQTSPKEPAGPNLIIPLALITDHRVLSAEYIRPDLCAAALAEM